MVASLLRAADHRRMPWKNGGGETTEIAVFPPDAGLSDFDWRVSMAKVAGDGPFSIFPGIDRTLSILEGNGMELSIAGQGAVRLDAASEPLPFPADAAVDARLTDGPITDLNVMTRRGGFTHSVRRMHIDHQTALTATGTPALLFCHRGTIEVDGDDLSAQLTPLDCLVLDEAAEKTLRLSGTGTFFLIEIRRG
ncbi:HutD-family protein [Paramesorhizobium deserti]|uniref:HutD-family protein n=1 Tax=Paramesorhizobium deserti TaxID=1494590 RepID=A0A135HTW7_9HYPH|nr:HutD family protein [Paramesorhizobium deserti]KXF76632.1 HutD-family protein [Paramesorhizobium deserti]